MTQANRNPTTNDRLTTVLSYGILLLLGYLVFRITAPFLVPLAWSAVLAIFFFPAFLFLSKRVSVSTAALLCTLGVTLVLIVPVLLVLVFAGREAVEMTVRIRGLISSGGVVVPASFADTIRHHLPHSLQNLDFMDSLQQGMEKIASYLAGSLAGMLKNLFAFVVDLFILLFALFFVFRDGESILRALRHLIPFEKSLQDEMLTESRDLIFASVAVALLIAAIQGVLGGAAFALTHLPAPVFMGVLIAFFQTGLGNLAVYNIAAVGVLFHRACGGLGIDLGAGGAVAGPQWKLGKSRAGADHLRRRGGCGGQCGASPPASQPHPPERLVALHQHSWRVAGLRPAGAGGWPDHRGRRPGCLSSLHGAPGRTRRGQRVTSCHPPGLNSGLPASLYARVRARMAKTTEMTITKPKELGLEKLRWRCELSRIPFETTAQAQKREGFIGQERALRALKMGVELSAPGYNVFVCGLAGTSRGGTIAQMIEELHPATKPSMDRCYVNNFKITDRPRLLVLPRGSANLFKKDVQAGIDFLRRRIPQVFEGEPFQRQKGRIVERFSVREKELMDDFTRRIARDQFALGHMQVGAVALPEIFPVLEGQMVPIEDISKMVHEGKLETGVAEEIERKYEQFRQEFTVVYRKTLTLSREMATELSYLEQEAASVLVDGVIEELKEKYPGTTSSTIWALSRNARGRKSKLRRLRKFSNRNRRGRSAILSAFTA